MVTSVVAATHYSVNHFALLHNSLADRTLHLTIARESEHCFVLQRWGADSIGYAKEENLMLLMHEEPKVDGEQEDPHFAKPPEASKIELPAERSLPLVRLPKNERPWRKW